MLAEYDFSGGVRGKYVKRIDEELACVDCLTHYLKEERGCREVVVKREDDDPPDFWVIVDDVEFAAEVTSIVTGEAYRANCRRLRCAVAECAKQQGILGGTYVLQITRHPRLPNSRSGEWRALLTRATSFIRTTRHAEPTQESRLLEDSHGHLGIRKSSGHKAAVGLLGFEGLKWEEQIQDELYERMQRAVNEKRIKLQKKGVSSRCPRIILLFYDAYGNCDAEDAQKALLRVNGYDWFHSVFWAGSFSDGANQLSPDQPARRGTFLYSADESWWTTPAK